ncbi:MAG: hypothetical protein QXD55_01515 [Candidatus Aenigmatarchaeota archaeon]
MTENISCKLAKQNCYKNCPVKDLALDLQTYWNDGIVEAAEKHYMRKEQKYRELTGMPFIPK